MSEAIPSDTIAAAALDETAAKTIALETHSTVDVVKRIYTEEFTALADHAKLRQFLDVLVGRRVRMRLRAHTEHA